MIGMIAMGIVIRTCHLLPDSFIAVSIPDFLSRFSAPGYASSGIGGGTDNSGFTDSHPMQAPAKC